MIGRLEGLMVVNTKKQIKVKIEIKVKLFVGRREPIDDF